MRRLFLILLLAILPVQYVWSAAAAYCGHEQEKTQHFGHHAHEHNSQASSQDGDGDGDGDGRLEGDGGKGKLPGKAKVHADCAVCHHAVQASLLAGMAPPPGAVSGGYPPSPDSRFTSHNADGPKKPDWHPAA